MIRASECERCRVKPQDTSAAITRAGGQRRDHRGIGLSSARAESGGAREGGAVGRVEPPALRTTTTAPGEEVSREGGLAAQAPP
eukprot:2488966-Prymnesium_polylepis.1